MANRGVFQSPQAAAEDQVVRGHHRERAQDADLDSTDHDAAPAVAQKARRVAVVAFEPGRVSTFEPARPSGFARMAG